MSSAAFLASAKLGNPRHVLFFDQFGIVRSEHFVEFHFGHKCVGMGVSNGLVVVMAQEIISANKEAFVSYLSNVGLPESPRPSDLRIRDAREVVFADLFAVACHGNSGELLFNSFSWKIAVDATKSAAPKSKSKETPVVETMCVAILRSDLETHRNLIATLYEETEE